MTFNPYGALVINRGNRIWIVFHLYCCSKHKVSTIHIANVANLDRFVTLSVSVFLSFLSLYIIFDWITIVGIQ